MVNGGEIWIIANSLFTLRFKVLFMDSHPPSLDTLRDIKRIMERSSRFISLSGLSGLSAGVCALVGAYLAYDWIGDYSREKSRVAYPVEIEHDLKIRLISLALGVLAVALALAWYFTWKKARTNKLPLWDHSSKKLLVNLLIPLVTGGLFVIGLLVHNAWPFVAPACLVFYGLALVNASKYTLTDIRYLGLLEIILGTINLYYPHLGLYFWAIGFGLLHIVYGSIMWWKYDKSGLQQ